MSETIDFGIDLGTTNSVMAVMDGGRPVIIFGPDDRELTPSFVGVNRRGEIEVGKAAKNQMLTDPHNGADGFKRSLSDLATGDLAQWTFPANGETYSAVDLSAILLTELVRSAAVFLNENPTSAVITVPAAFGELEKSSIMEASRKSGLSHVQLVQEPVAAGLAYGWDRANDARPFLIYDIGGGTFDLSLMRCESGQLVVMGHKGERVQGGRDIDARLLDEILATIFRDRVSQDEWNEKRPILLQLCETAKERLSRADNYTITIEGRLTSLDGDPITDVVNIRRREDLEPLLEPLLSRTAELMEELLEEQSLNIGELTAIVLVGGPSRTPALREFLEKRFGVGVHTTINPMTVVAQGAAFYAASILKPVTRPQAPTPGVASIRLSFDPVSALTTAPVGIAAESADLPNGTELRISRADGSWASGLVAVHDGRALSQVVLSEGEQCKFTLRAYHPNGTEIPLTPSEFSITHGLAAAPPPLSRSVGVVVTIPGEDSLDFSILAKRGDPTPVSNRRTYRTTRAISPGDASGAIEIHFREGESSNPLRNRAIGMVAIKGSEVDHPLPAGSDVEITLRISPSEGPTARVYIPLLNMTWDNKLETDYDNPPKDIVEDLHYRFYAEEIRLRQLQSAGADTNQLESIVHELQREFNSRGPMDRDSIKRAQQQVENLENRLDQQEEAMGPARALTALGANEEVCIELIDQLGDQAEQRELDRLKTQAAQAREATDGQLALRTSEALLKLASAVYWAQDGAWVARFQELAEIEDFTDPQKASYLVQQGRAALDTSDLSVLHQVVLGLIDLLPESEVADPLAVFRGLRELR